jgi:hypothetical protein
MDENKVRQIIREELSSLIGIDRYLFQKNIQIFDARNIQLGRENGTQIGTDTDQKLGFYGETPVTQQAKVDDPSGGETVDSEARTAVKEVIDVLENLGLTSKT